MIHSRVGFLGFLTKTEPSPVSKISNFSRFFRVFQCFLRFFNVFHGVSRFLSLSSDEQSPLPGFGQGGVAFFNFKGKIVFGDPPLPQTPTPLERESLHPKWGDPRIVGGIFQF